MMHDPLSILWIILDQSEPMLSAESLSRYGAKVRAWLEAQHLLRPTHAATHVSCPDCDDGHLEEVELVPDPAGVPRYFIVCPQSLRVEIPERCLSQWTLDLDAVACAVAAAMSLRGKPKPLMPGRLWRLGKATVKDSAGNENVRDVLLARGLQWQDGDVVRRSIAASGRAITLITTEHFPTALSMPSSVILPLPRVSSATSTGIELDLAHLWTLVRDAEEQLKARGEPDVRQTIGRKVSKMQSQAFDVAALAQLYKSEGSLRKTEAALRARGVDMDHATIGRELKKLEVDIAEVRSSESVVRAVASQRRDKGRKRLPPRKDQT
jgi:hypothetical protein